jgi:hypothetical protein
MTSASITIYVVIGTTVAFFRSILQNKENLSEKGKVKVKVVPVLF